MEPRWWLLIGILLLISVYNRKDSVVNEDLRFARAAGNPLGMLDVDEDAVTRVDVDIESLVTGGGIAYSFCVILFLKLLTVV
jgi:hypothetical protein